MHDKSTACTKSFPEEADRPMNYLQLKKAEAYDNTAGTLVVLIKDFINIPSQLELKTDILAALKAHVYGG